VILLIFELPANPNDDGPTWCGVDESAVTAPAPSSDVEHGLVVEKTLWDPNTTITYGYMPAIDEQRLATPYRKDRVRKALNLYSANSFLTFNDVGDITNDYSIATIRIAFGKPSQNYPNNDFLWGWSYVGKEATYAIHDPATVRDPAAKNPRKYPGPKYTTIYIGGQPMDEINERLLADSSHPDAAVSLALEKQTLYHEIGHALGFYHEHISPNSEAASDEATISQYLVATIVSILTPS
jgi:hypothetical protein